MRFQKQENKIGSLNLPVVTILSNLMSPHLTCEFMSEENKRREAGNIYLVFTACQTEHWLLSPPAQDISTLACFHPEATHHNPAE